MKESNPDILLTICPPWGVINPPLGLAYIAESLEQNGFNVDVFDLNVSLYNSVSAADRELWRTREDNFWRSRENVEILLAKWSSILADFTDKIAASKASVIGFSIVDPNEYFSAFVIKLIREKAPEKIIIAGGPACSDKGQRGFLMNHCGDGIDYFVLGEGEQTIVNLLFAIQQGKATDALENVVSGSGTLEYTAPLVRPDLKKLNHPKFNAFDVSLYGGTSLAVMWSRGCVGRCLYCKEKALWGTYRMRDIASIIEELRYAVNKLKIRNFVVYDSAVNGNLKLLEELCDEIIRLKLDITWSGEAIALKGMEQKLLDKMAKAGCHTLVYGIESGSDSVLSIMRKLSDRENAAKVLRRTHKAGIKVAINILVGFPGETDEDFQATLDFLSENRDNIDRLDGVSTLQIVAGTPLEERLDEFGIILPPVNGNDKWYIPGENDHDLRQQRLKTILERAQTYGFSVGRTFLAEPGRPLVENKRQDNSPVPVQPIEDWSEPSEKQPMEVKARFGQSGGRKILLVTCQSLVSKNKPATGGGIRGLQLGEALADCGHSVLYCIPDNCDQSEHSDVSCCYRTIEDIPSIIAQTGAELVLFGNWGLACEAPYVDVPAIVDMNGSLILENYYRNRGSLFKDSFAKLEAIAKTDFQIAGSKQQKMFLLGWSLMAGVDPDHLSIGVVPYSLSPVDPVEKQNSELRFIIAGYDWPWLKGGETVQTICSVLDDYENSSLHVFTASPPYSDMAHENSADDLAGELADQQYQNLVQHGPVDFESLMTELEKASVAVDLWQKNAERELAFSSRTVAYLRAGLPVITTPSGELAELIEQYKAGWLLESSDLTALKELVGQIADKTIDIEEYQANARRLFTEKLSREKTIGELNAFCEKPFFNRNFSPFVAKYNFAKELSLKLIDTAANRSDTKIKMLEQELEDKRIECEIMGLVHRRPRGLACLQSWNVFKRKVRRIVPGLPVLVYMAVLTMVGHCLHLMWIRRNKS